MSGKKKRGGVVRGSSMDRHGSRYFIAAFAVCVFLLSGCTFGGLAADVSEWDVCGERVRLSADFSATDFGDRLGETDGRQIMHFDSALMLLSPEDLSVDDIFIELPEQFDMSEVELAFDSFKQQVAATPDELAFSRARLIADDCTASIHFDSPSTGLDAYPEHLWNIAMLSG